MRRVLFAAVAAVAVGGCSHGPAPLGYAVPGRSPVSYVYADTTRVGVSMMGQRMELSMLGRADFDVSFAEAEAAPGVEVRVDVRDLDVSVAVPMAGTEMADEGDVDGALVFILDHRGRALVTSVPEVSVTASRVVSRLGTAHTLFPRLPGRVVFDGDEWVDTISFEGQAEAGEMAETSVVRYTVVGDTTVAGRRLTKIGMEGTTELRLGMSMGAMSVAPEAEMEMTGHVLWDPEAGLPFELLRTASGPGTVRVPGVPAPLPITVETTQRLRLGG